jgi:hypothetical protein
LVLPEHLPQPKRNLCRRLGVSRAQQLWRIAMGRGLLLWLIGIPLPIILIVWLFGGLS